MIATRLDRLRLAREIPQVALLRYNQIRSKSTGQLILAFEGKDDVAFYDAILIRLLGKVDYAPLVCDGKDRVLGLRVLLSRSTTAGAKDVRYFIDKDFDGLKGHKPGNDLYCTPTYSIENLLVDEQILLTLLRGEYRCSDENAADDIARIRGLYGDRLTEFLGLLKETNQLIHYARTLNIHINSIENDLKKYVQVSLEQVHSANPRTPPWKLIGMPKEVPNVDLVPYDHAFNELDPIREWRGKFVFAFFRKFLAELKEDRGCKAPRYFNKRAVMSFNPQGDITRSLASIAEIPPCLAEFFRRAMSLGDSAISA